MSRVRREQLRACEAEAEAERLRARVLEAESETAAAREARREALDLAGAARRERADAEAREESLKATFRAAKGLGFTSTSGGKASLAPAPAAKPNPAKATAAENDVEFPLASAPFGLGDAWEETPRPIGELPPPPEPLEGSDDEAGSDDATASARGGARETTARPAAKAGRPPLRPRTPKNDARGRAGARRK